MTAAIPIRIGVSACLLGEQVRYDGGHKRNRFLTELLGKHVEFVRVCPEVEFGLGVPRETIELVRIGEDVRLRFTTSDRDITDAMREFAARRVPELKMENLSGYILKRGSPSCGMQEVKVRHSTGEIDRIGIGLFAEALVAHFPHLPVEEEGRLAEPKLRADWLSRVFAYHREAFGGDLETHRSILADVTSGSTSGPCQ